MKHIVDWAKCLAIAIIAVIPSMLKGQDILSSIVSNENKYIYSYSYSSSELYESKGSIGQVFLSTVSDELIVKKKTDVSQEKVTEAILNIFPSAQISWIKNYDDVCFVISDKNAIEIGLSELMSDDDIISVRPGYIRSTYVDLMKLYPVSQVATYGFDDQIYVEIKSECSDEANTLISSLGFRTELTPDSNPLTQFIYVSKESDIIAIANTLFESGFFISSSPSSHIVVRNIDGVTFDNTNLDFYYNLNGNKQYLYKSPGRFIIKKDKDTDKVVIESIISKYLTSTSFEWETDNLCKLDIDDSLVDDAINNISKEESVIYVSRSYLIPSEYERTLVEGTDYPKDFNYDENITIIFIDGVSESIKDSLKNAYNLTTIKEGVAFYTWAADKKDNVLHICKGLYESGYLECATPNWVTGFKIIWPSSNQTASEYYLDYGDPNSSLKVYYNAIPDRLFIQKSSDVSQDYIISLLSNIVGSQIDVSWCPAIGFQDDYCRVILDEALIDSVINELLKDEGVLIARRTYVEKEAYDNYVSFTKQSGVEFSEYLDSILMKDEIWFLNEIKCYPYAPNPNGIPMDSICNEYGLTYDYSEYRFNVKVTKNVDFFEIAHNLLETGCFIRVDVNRITPYSDKEMSFGDLPGSVINKADHFFFYWSDGSKSLYHKIPNRLFVQKSNDISKEYMVALLNGLIGNEYEIRWFNDAICEVIVDDDMSDDIINELLKDDGILLARHAFISEGDYDKYLYYPYLEKYEVCFCNDNIRCWFKDGYDRAVIDNLCLVLGLIIESENNTFVVFKSSKSSDIFEVLQKLFETGCFESIDAPLFTPYDTWNEVSSVSAVAQEKIYYNTSGRRTENPSGLTIVVTRYSDGTVRTEKKFFR